MEILKANGKNVLEDAGVMPNPTVQKLQEGCKIAREGKQRSCWNESKTAAAPPSDNQKYCRPPQRNTAP